MLWIIIGPALAIAVFLLLAFLGWVFRNKIPDDPKADLWFGGYERQQALGRRWLNNPRTKSLSETWSQRSELRKPPEEIDPPAP